MTTGLLLMISKGLEPSRPITLRERPVTEHRCFRCASVVYSRRFPTCRECGAELPQRMLLHGRTAAKLREEIATSRERIRNYVESPGRSRGMTNIRF